MHRERFGDFLDGDIRVVLGTHIDPTVPAVNRATATADAHLDAVGRAHQVVLVEITVVTQCGVGPLDVERRVSLDCLATPRTELP